MCQRIAFGGGSGFSTAAPVPTPAARRACCLTSHSSICAARCCSCCTRDSPKSTCPASTSCLICSVDADLVTAISATFFGSRRAFPAAAAIESCTFLNRSNRFIERQTLPWSVALSLNTPIVQAKGRHYVDVHISVPLHRGTTPVPSSSLITL